MSVTLLSRSQSNLKVENPSKALSPIIDKAWPNVSLPILQLILRLHQLSPLTRFEELLMSHLRGYGKKGVSNVIDRGSSNRIFSLKELSPLEICKKCKKFDETTLIITSYVGELLVTIRTLHVK